MVPTKIRESVVWMRRVLLRRWWRHSTAFAFEVSIVVLVRSGDALKLLFCSSQWKLYLDCGTRESLFPFG